MQDQGAKPIEGGLLTKNVVFSFAGKIFPIIAGIISIPVLIDNIGTERFGVLSIIWLLIGYFGILDFGFTKSIIFELGKDIRSGGSKSEEITSTITTVLVCIGIIIGAVVILITPFLLEDLFTLNGAILEEARRGFLILGIGTPITMLSSSMRGILETFQDFKRTSITDTIFGGINYLGLAALSLFSSNLAYFVVVLVLIKLSIGITFFFLSRRFVRSKIFRFSIDTDLMKSAFNFGKWVAISNIINPIMGQIDRYIIGAVITMTAVTFYTAPFDMGQKISLIPVSITVVLFPAFTVRNGSSNESGVIFSNSILATITFVFPLTAVLVFFAKEILLIWLGAEFAEESFYVLQILIIGAFVNSIAKIPFTYLEGIGSPDITAKLHVSEFIGYIPVLWLLINIFGIIGAALARSSRVFIDWLVLITITRKKIEGRAYVLETLFLVMVLILLCITAGIQISLIPKVLIIGGLLVVYFFVLWNKYLDDNLKLSIVSKLVSGKKSAN